MDTEGRYAIRHAWTGEISCRKPQRGIWGGPPDGHAIADGNAAMAATNTAFAERGKVSLPNLVAQDIPELGVKQGVPLPGGAGFHSKAQGCGCAAQGTDALASGALLAGLAVLVTRRRRKETV